MNKFLISLGLAFVFSVFAFSFNNLSKAFAAEEDLQTIGYFDTADQPKPFDKIKTNILIGGKRVMPSPSPDFPYPYPAKLGKPVVPIDDSVIKSVSFGTSSVRSERDIIYGGDKLVVLPVDDVQV